MLDIPTVHLGNTNIQPIIYKSNKKKFKKVYVAIFVILVIVTGIVSDFIYKDIKRNEQYSQQLIRIEASLGAIIHACSGCLACISDAEAPKDKEEYHYAVLIQSFTDLDLSINTISLLYGRSIYDEGEPLQVFIELLSSKYMSLVNSSKNSLRLPRLTGRDTSPTVTLPLFHAVTYDTLTRYELLQRKKPLPANIDSTFFIETSMRYSLPSAV